MKTTQETRYYVLIDWNGKPFPAFCSEVPSHYSDGPFTTREAAMLAADWRRRVNQCHATEEVKQ